MRKELKVEINNYWTNRADGYSKVNQDELSGVQRGNWSVYLKDEIEKTLPGRKPDSVKIADIGGGPGFISIILAEMGYNVTYADCNEAMMEEAKANATAAGLDVSTISWLIMDAENLDFDEESFDVIVSRNLTWNLPHPEKAYESWVRVLKSGGALMNFDANWYNYLFDEELMASYEQDRENVLEAGVEDHYTCTDIDEMERLAKEMPLSALKRPDWDVKILEALGVEKTVIDYEAGDKLWSDVEKINYQSFPMFMIKATKGVYPDDTVNRSYI